MHLFCKLYLNFTFIDFTFSVELYNSLMCECGSLLRFQNAYTKINLNESRAVTEKPLLFMDLSDIHNLNPISLDA